MNDEICENCKYAIRGLCYLDAEFPTKWTRLHTCEKWMRHPNLWLSIPPTEPGYWFWRKIGSKNYGLESLDENDLQDKAFAIQGKMEWQGPLKPNQQNNRRVYEN